MDPIIFKAMNTSLQVILKSESLGLTLQSLILGVILTHTASYYRSFGSTDPRAWRWAVGLAGGVCLGQWGTSVYALSHLISCITSTSPNAIPNSTPNSIPNPTTSPSGTSTTTSPNSDRFALAFQTDLSCTMIITLFICFFRAAAAGYFSRRIWSLTGRKLLILIGLLGMVLACTGFGVLTIIYGFQSPPMEDLADLSLLAGWFKKIAWTAKAWAITSPIIDLVVCACTIVLLLRSKSAMGGRERTLLKRVVWLTTETMIPPALMSIGILIFFEVNGIYGSYDRTLIWIIGPSYYLTVLHSLVARQQLAAVIFPAPISGYPPLPEENRYLHTRSSTGTNAARGANISNPVLVQDGQWEMPDWERSRDQQRRMSFFDDSLEERGEVGRMDAGEGVEAWRMRSNSEKSWKSNGDPTSNPMIKYDQENQGRI